VKDEGFVVIYIDDCRGKVVLHTHRRGRENGAQSGPMGTVTWKIAILRATVS
jgi:hypothetical protein